MTDPIADMLTRIRNGLAARKAEVRMPKSNLKLWIANILVKEGYLASAEESSEDRGTLRLVLKYANREPAIHRIDRVSKPGQRIYASASELPAVSSGLGLAIVSTSAGVMTNREARKRKLGGEIICEVE
ncbi:30S ribosomal protein S8 [Candidatus Uhrbacteria bacterium]|nr:30S ribosomal protein S8 [Candidatus Uhrbacteria bacterium]